MIEFIDNDISYRDINVKYRYIFYDNLLYNGNFKAKAISIDAGEHLKTWNGVASIIELFQNLGISRKDHILVVGGGTMQDAFGFACSIYNRGISWDYMPTTLGAMCDSCLGGKTSINFGGSKNIIGTFSDPTIIYIDTEWLKTASEDSILSGLGEMNHIFAVAQRYDLMKNVEEEYQSSSPTWRNLIKQCQDIKSSFIEEDKFDKDKRLLLNYGHTFGHALEANTNIPHGIAVAWGAMFANKISNDFGFMSEGMTNYLNDRFKWIASRADIKFSDLKEDFFLSLSKDKKNYKEKDGTLYIGCILMTEGQAKLHYISFNDLKRRINDVYSNG